MLLKEKNNARTITSIIESKTPVINLRLKLFFFNCILHVSYKRPFLPGKLGIIFCL